MYNNLTINSVISELELIDAEINSSDILLTVYDKFEMNKNIPGLILLRNGNFFGLLSRKKFFELMSKQFMYDIFSKRTVDYFFSEDQIKTHLILNSSTSILLATTEALKRKDTDIFEPIIVNCGSQGFKLLDFYQLLLAQNKIQLLMNALLIEANEFKKDVLAIVTHDLHNPIGTILGFSDLLSENDSIEKSKEFARNIFQTASHMRNLVNGFLVSAIKDSIEFELECSNFDIVEMLHSVIKDFEVQSLKKEQNISSVFEDKELIIYSDKSKVKEVIENILSNAIKYSEQKKEIKITLKQSLPFIEICVIDQGPGFSDSDLAHAFGKFQKLSAKPTGQESTNGLGLFISKKIVDKLNGSIELKSELRKGTTIKIKLPYEATRINL